MLRERRSRPNRATNCTKTAPRSLPFSPICSFSSPPDDAGALSETPPCSPKIETTFEKRAYVTDMVTEDRSELLVMLLVHDDDPGSYALARQAPGHRVHSV